MKANNPEGMPKQEGPGGIGWRPGKTEAFNREKTYIEVECAHRVQHTQDLCFG